MVRVVCTECGRGGAGDNPPYNCVDLGGRGGCGGQKTMVAVTGSLLKTVTDRMIKAEKRKIANAKRK